MIIIIIFEFNLVFNVLLFDYMIDFCDIFQSIVANELESEIARNALDFKKSLQAMENEQIDAFVTMLSDHIGESDEAFLRVLRPMSLGLVFCLYC
jgi:hypothetical protein